MIVKTLSGVKENVEETLEIERRKINLVIHGEPETDADEDLDAIAVILQTGLHMDFERYVASVMRIGKLDDNKPMPIRLVIKSMDGKKQILSRAMELEEVEEYKRMFISPDLTMQETTSSSQSVED